jgi:dTDP-glucose 4,6-dehydratase
LKNILVTGGAGFIGSNFVELILNRESDIKLINIDKLTDAGTKDNIKDSLCDPRHVFLQGDILDKTFIKDVFYKYNIDTVVHFAAESHVDNSIKSPELSVLTNVVGTLNLLEASREYWEFNNFQNKRFHHISTDEVFGSLGYNDASFTEETRYDPRSPYSASKASSDHLVRAYFNTYGLPVSVSNCSNNFGPKQYHEKLIPLLIKNCLEGLPVPIYGDGSNIRDWLYVSDHCEAIYLILKKGLVGETYNIGGSCEVSNLDMAHMIFNKLDKLVPRANGLSYKDLLVFVDDRAGHDFRYSINGSKMLRELNWEPKGNIDDYLDKTINFYIQKFNINKFENMHEEA